MPKTFFQVSSSGFAPGARMPAKYTADGPNISPPLTWSNPPDGTQSFALILDDPDAPYPGGFTHWVLYNIPANQSSLPENIPPAKTLPDGGTQGTNGAGKLGYMGAAPPPGSGTHLYRFNLYALDAMLDLKPGAFRDQVLEAMSGHMIGNALVTATYSRATQPTSGK